MIASRKRQQARANPAAGRPLRGHPVGGPQPQGGVERRPPAGLWRRGGQLRDDHDARPQVTDKRSEDDACDREWLNAMPLGGGVFL